MSVATFRSLTLLLMLTKSFNLSVLTFGSELIEYNLHP
jgi:hypothetical protein